MKRQPHRHSHFYAVQGKSRLNKAERSASLLCALLADQPLIGHTREDLTPRPVLFWSSGRYLLVYRPETEPVRIVAIFPGSRDVASLLTDRE